MSRRFLHWAYHRGRYPFVMLWLDGIPWFYAEARLAWGWHTWASLMLAVTMGWCSHEFSVEFDTVQCRDIWFRVEGGT